MPLYLEFREDKSPYHRVSFYLDIDINIMYWDQESQTVLGPHPDADDLNLIISQTKAKANDIVIRYRLQKKYLSCETFKLEFQGNINTEDFLKFFEQEIAIKGSTKEYQTAITYKVALKKLFKFKKSVRFGDLDFKFIRDFDIWMEKGKLSMNTRTKYHKKVRHVINNAIRQGFDMKNPYKDFPLKENQTERVYLDREELQGLSNYYWKCPEDGTTKQEILRAFLFSCFTSIRISDVQVLNHKNFIKGKVVFHPKKTRGTQKKIEIPLSQPAKKLLDLTKTGRQFNLPSDQKVNQNLKTIGSAAGLEKHLTYHVSRHTFATLFLELGGRVEVLKEILGHYNIRDTMIYVHIVDKQKETQIRLFDQLS